MYVLFQSDTWIDKKGVDHNVMATVFDNDPSLFKKKSQEKSRGLLI